MTKREEIQQEALTVALNNHRCGLGISMGVGKTYIGLQYLNHKHELPGSFKKALVVAPKKSIFQSWIDDATKFQLQDLLEKVEFTTYLSLNKKDYNEYDLVVMDECHSLLPTHRIFLTNYNGPILGLTGTPPRYTKTDKGQMVLQYCPIRYKYITDDAVEDQILNDYRIIVHRMPLSTANNLPVKTKKGTFYTSEAKNYGYWSSRVAEASTMKETQIASVMRMRAMMDFRTKEDYAKELLEDIEDKCIVFCNTQDQADRICPYSYHSGNPDSEENLQSFKDGDIEELSCVLQLNEGINIPNLRAGIILHAYGNERKSSQRIGRLLRLNPNDRATVHILCYSGTIDDRWVTEALKDLDPAKIQYHDVNKTEHESIF